MTSHIPLVECTRGELVESVHFGSFAVVTAAGGVLHAGGEPDAPMYARSSLKPLQLAAMVDAGLELPDDLLALGAASHSGAAEHLEGVERILTLHGLDASVLRNTPDLPYGPRERESWLREGGERTRLAHNCSGKHAAMLATCVVNGWDVEGYLDPGHPLQRAVAAALAETTDAAASTVDGCGTPLPAGSLSRLARAYARLASAPPGTPEGIVAGAMRRHPRLVAGEGRDDTELMRAVPGLVAKHGAEGVQAVGLADGTGLAVKISDGRARARLPITLRLLEVLVDEPSLAGIQVPPVRGGGADIGLVRAIGGIPAG